MTNSTSAFLWNSSGCRLWHWNIVSLWITGRDVIAQAQSGTGKTATFSIAILQQLNIEEKDCQALVLAPTRELAQQVNIKPNPKLTCFELLSYWLLCIILFPCLLSDNFMENVNVTQCEKWVIMFKNNERILIIRKPFLWMFSDPESCDSPWRLHGSLLSRLHWWNQCQGRHPSPAGRCQHCCRNTRPCLWHDQQKGIK